MPTRSRSSHRLRGRWPLAAARALLLTALFAAPSARGATYFVEPPPAGDDAHSGTSAAPWATLQHAADTLAAGDTVIVRQGEYTGFHLTTSGTEAAPIVFRAEPGSEVEIVADNAVTPDGVNLEGASWVTIEGFRVDGRTRAGIRAVLCEHVTLRGNRMDQNGRWGILTGFCDDLLIEDNVATRSMIEHGIYVSNSGDRPIVRRNRLEGNFANGLHMNGDVSLGGDGIISGARVEANIIVSNGEGGGSGINCDGVQDSLIRNNLIVASRASGISLYRIDGGGASTGNRVLANTILVASDGRWGLNLQNGATDTTLANNVVHSEHSFRGAISISPDSLPGLVSDHNALEDRFTLDDGDSVIDLAAWRAQTGQDANSFAAVPADLFIDPAGDFRPFPGSPLLDAGQALPQVPTDLDGVPRPQGTGWDIGAYEGTTAPLFVDGFESGTTAAWESAEAR